MLAVAERWAAAEWDTSRPGATRNPHQPTSDRDRGLTDDTQVGYCGVCGQKAVRAGVCCFFVVVSSRLLAASRFSLPVDNTRRPAVSTISGEIRRAIGNRFRLRGPSAFDDPATVQVAPRVCAFSYRSRRIIQLKKAGSQPIAHATPASWSGASPPQVDLPARMCPPAELPPLNAQLWVNDSWLEPLAGEGPSSPICGPRC